MPRTRKITETKSEEATTSNTENKPEPQIITVPTLGVISEMSNFLASDNSIKPDKKFDINLRLYAVYDNGEFVESIPENSQKLDDYLMENKKQLDQYISELKEMTSDPNLLIFFHEGKQERNYMTFDSYYAQNGLAPKSVSINSWMQFYKSKYPLMSEEEIAIKVKGNLRYSFTFDTNNDV